MPLMLFVALPGCANFSMKEDVRLRSPALATSDVVLKVPKATYWELSNGLTVFYLFDGELPEVHGKIYFPGGEMFDSSGIAGLAEAAGSQMRDGSVEGYSPFALDRYLDELAATIDSDFGMEYGSVKFHCLSEDFSEVFSLFSRVVRQPSFETSRLNLWKELAAEKIRHRRDNPDVMAEMAFRSLVYGQNSPYARDLSVESLGRIDRTSLKNFHRTFVHPDKAVLVVSGAVAEDKVRKEAEQYFGDWPRVSRVKEIELPLPQPFPPGIYLLERDLKQATVYLGHVGPPRHTEDEFSIMIYNRILGEGSFGTLLFNEIRSKLGLAYGVQGAIRPGLGNGLFQVSLATRPEEVVRAVQSALSIIEETRVDLPQQEVFFNAQSTLERTFLFKFVSANQIVNREALLKIMGFKQGYDDRFLSNIKNVQPHSVRSVAHRWINPKDLVIVVIGKVPPQGLAEGFSGRFKVNKFEFDTEARF